LTGKEKRIVSIGKMSKEEFQELDRLHRKIFNLLVQNPGYSLKSTKQADRLVDVSNLKELAAKMLEPDSALRDILLREREILPTDEFLAKMDIWLKLLGREFMKK
jgi:hypothetical protein